MKKVASWYLVGLSLFFAWIGYGFVVLNHEMFGYYESHQNIRLTPLGDLVVKTRMAWWPFLYAAVSLGAGILGFVSDVQNAKLMHVAFWLLFLSMATIFAVGLGYSISAIPRR